jgi:hypothetical protein
MARGASVAEESSATAGKPASGSGFTVWLPALIIMCVLCARWIRITGFGDFGMDLDFVSRLGAGQWQGRDFFAVFPFLPGYSLLLFQKLLGDRYIVVNIHVWFWWFVNALAAGGVLRACGVNGFRVVFTVATVALLTVVPNTHSSSFAFMASALSGLCAILLIRCLRSGKGVQAFLAGVIGGTAVFAKPNVGMAITMAAAAVPLAMSFFRKAERRFLIATCCLVLAGGVAGFLGTLAIPGYYGGYKELLTEIFSGGAEIKGGVLVLILRTIPRISTGIDSPYRFLIELLIAFPIFGLFVALFSRLAAPGSANGTTRPSGKLLLWLICAAVVVLSVWSLFPWDVPKLLTQSFQSARIVSLPFFLWQILYLAALAGLLVSLVQGALRSEFHEDILSPFWLTLLALIWTGGVVASARHNSIFAATLFVPAIALRANGRCNERAFYRLATALIVLWTVAWHVAPTFRSTFAHLVELPADSKFAGLYWPEGGASVPGSYPEWPSASTISECQKNIAPRVAGHSVLWLVPAIGSAFGGRIYSFGIHGLAANNISVAAERKFANSVMSSPPDFIVATRFDSWNDPKWSFLRPDVIEPWLREHYDLVWRFENQGTPLFMWQLKQKVQHRTQISPLRPAGI